MLAAGREISHILSARFGGSLSGNATLQAQSPADLSNARYTTKWRDYKPEADLSGLIRFRQGR